MPQDPNDYPVGTIIIEPGKDNASNAIYRVMSARKEEGRKSFKEIGNFYIDCLASGLDNEGNIKYLLNINGKLRVCDRAFIATPTAFRDFIRPYTWFGNTDDTESLAKLVFDKVRNQKEDNFIILSDFVGFFKHEKLEFWVFEQLILITKKDGEDCFLKVMIPVNNGIFRIDDLWIAISQTNINKALIPVYVEPENYSLEEFLQDWLNQIKNKTLLYSQLGWNVASLFLEKVNACRKTRFFPFYVVTAATEAGKTSLLANCINMFGVRYIGENFASSVTRFVEMVEFARVSHMPIWRDEYKNEKYALEKEGWLRSVYTRSNSSRGNANQEVNQFATNATLLLSGEDITDDPALSRRMIKMRLKKGDKVEKADYQKNTIIAREKFPMVFPLILKHGFDSTVFSEIFDNPDNWLQHDTDQKDELMCYAALGAVFGREHALKAIETARAYHLTIKDDVVNDKQVTIDEFFNVLHALFVERGSYDSQFNNRPKVLDYFYFPSNDKVWFQFPSLHALINKNRAKDEYRWTKKAIGQLIVETYGARVEPRHFDNQSARMMIVEDWNKFNDSFGDLLASVYATQKAWKEKNVVLDSFETF